MKCPKCKFITFDYLDICPRCKHSLSNEKSKWHIDAVKPQPLFLLGSLTGDLDDSTAISITGTDEEQVDDIETSENEVYDDGIELELNIDGENLIESEEDIDLNSVELNLPKENNEIELGLPSDDRLSGNEDTVLDFENVDLKNSQESESDKNLEEIDLGSDELELELDFDED